jgi:hypothetical protein
VVLEAGNSRIKAWSSGGPYCVLTGWKAESKREKIHSWKPFFYNSFNPFMMAEPS